MCEAPLLLESRGKKPGDITLGVNMGFVRWPCLDGELATVGDSDGSAAQLTFAHSLDLLCVFNSEGYLLDVNPRWEQILGYSAKELKEVPYLEFVHPDDRAATCQEALSMFAEGTNAAAFENRYRTKAGAYVRLQWFGRAVPNRGVAVASARNVTELRDDFERFELALEGAPTGILMADRSGVIVLVNRQAEALFGYSRKEFLGQRVEMLVPELARSGHERLRSDYAKSPSTRRMGGGRDLFARRRDGSQFPVEIGLNPLVTSKGSFVMASVVDITTRIEQETRLKKHVAELQQHRMEMTVLAEMSSYLQHAVSESEILAIVQSYGERLFRGAGATVFLLPPSRVRLERKVSWNESPVDETLAPSECWALRRSQTHEWVSGQPAACPHYDHTDGRRHLCVPMTAHGNLLGLVTLAESPGEDLMNATRSFAEKLALALSNLELSEKLRMLSIRDELTGLYNRRYLDETIEREFDRAARRRYSLTLLMMDVDHFKRLNDAFGHKKGDDVLQAVGKAIRDATRADDIACRYGGEEFVVLLPDCRLEDGVARAEKIRAQIPLVTEPQATLSIGVASFPSHAVSWDELFRMADEALFEAKHQGRNRVVCSSAAPQRDRRTDTVDRALLDEGSNLEGRLLCALRGIYMAYQPIVRWSTKELYGYEAFLRSADTRLNAPMDIIRAAERLGRLRELHRIIRDCVADAAAEKKGPRLFVRIDADDLKDEMLFLRESPLSQYASLVVLDIRHRASNQPLEDVVQRIQSLRDMGFHIASDDLEMSAKKDSPLEIIKIDMSLVRAIDQNLNHQSMVREMAAQANDRGTLLVAEGVETIQERETLTRLGCDLFQGYLFGKPDQQFLPVSW